MNNLIQSNTVRHLEPQIQSLLEAFLQTFTQPDKIKREDAILFIKSKQQDKDFLEKLFYLLSQYQIMNLSEEVLKSIINWIQKYILKQYEPNQKHSIQHSRPSLLKIVTEGIKGLTRVNFPHKLLIILCKPLSVMLNHQFNQTLKYQTIASFRDDFQKNTILVFYQTYSILLETQSPIVLNKILVYYKQMIDYIGKCEQSSKQFYFEVVYMILSQSSKTLDRYSIQQMIENQTLLNSLDNNIMSGKIEMSEMPFRILILLCELKEEFQIKTTTLLNRLNLKLFPLVYNFLDSSKEYNNQLQFTNHLKENETLIIIMLKYFTNLLKIGKDEKEFHERKVDILLNIIFPYFTMTEHQATQLMNDSPHQYLKIKQEIASAGKTQIVQAVAAYLMEIYCDKVDGIVITAFDIAINIIKNKINSQLNPIDKSYENTCFFRCFKQQTKLETALMVLCIISYAIQTRSECINAMEQIIQNHLIVLFNPEQPIIAITFLYMLCYFMDVLFRQENKHYLRSYIVDSILVFVQINPCQTLVYQIYDFIEHTIADGEYNMVIRDRTLKICKITIENVLDYDDIEALRVFQTMLLEQTSNIIANFESEFLQWLSKLSVKLQSFLSRNIYNQFVAKTLSLFNSLISSTEYEDFIDAIYGYFQHFMLIFNNPKQQLLLDEVIVIINRYIEIKETVPEKINILLDNIHQILQVNDSNIYNTFRTLCFILIYSKDTDQVRKVFDLGLITLKETTTKIRSILNPLEGTLLIHLTLYHHIFNFNSEALLDLIETTMNILGYQYIKSHKVMYAKYLLIIIQCLNFRFQETTQILKQIGENTIQKFYELFFDPGVYYDGYDRKLLVTNLINIIYNKDFDGSYAHISLKTIINVLFAQYNSVQLNVTNSYQDSSESQVDEKKEMQLTLSQNTRQIFKLYPNPYDSRDEYADFNELITKIKAHESSAQILEAVVNQLPIGIKKFLVDYALRIKRVVGENKKIEKRKIFKVKRDASQYKQPQ